MKTLTKLMVAALTAAAVVGCDPFEEAVSGPPAVTGAGVTDTANGVGYSARLSGSAWIVGEGIASNPNVPSICGLSTAGVPELSGFAFVKFNKLLDGYSIQTSTADCTPAAALNLAVTYNGGAPPAGTAWYACYNPSAPAPTEGASVIIFLGDAALPPGGWIDAVPIPTSGDAVTTVHATGTAHDKEGAAASFDVTANIDPDPGVPGTPTFANITATSVDVNWAAAECAVGGTTAYVVERGPAATGPWTVVTPTPTTALTFTDTGLTTATTYYYRVTAESSGGVSGAPSTAASVTTL